MSVHYVTMLSIVATCIVCVVVHTVPMFCTTYGGGACGYFVIAAKSPSCFHNFYKLHYNLNIFVMGIIQQKMSIQILNELCIYRS